MVAKGTPRRGGGFRGRAGIGPASRYAGGQQRTWHRTRNWPSLEYFVAGSSAQLSSEEGGKLGPERRQSRLCAGNKARRNDHPSRYKRGRPNHSYVDRRECYARQRLVSQTDRASDVLGRRRETQRGVALGGFLRSHSG